MFFCNLQVQRYVQTEVERNQSSLYTKKYKIMIYDMEK